MKKQGGYIVVGIEKANPDNIQGYVEHSFSMGFSYSDVRVWRDFEYEHSVKYSKVKNPSGNQTAKFFATKDVKERCVKLKKAHPDFDWKFYRIGTKHCPIAIDWERYHKLAKVKKLDKYSFRNLKFRPKSGR